MYYVGTCISLVRRGYIYQPYKCTSWVHLSALHYKCTSLVHLSALRTTWLHVSVLHNNYTGVRAEVLENTTVVARRCVFADCTSSTEQHTTRPLLWQTSTELKKQRAELCAHTTVALRSEWARWLHSEDQYTTQARIWWDHCTQMCAHWLHFEDHTQHRPECDEILLHTEVCVCTLTFCRHKHMQYEARKC